MKWLLFIGLGFLTIGIIFNKVYTDTFWPYFFIFGGVVVKVTYVSVKIVKSNYRPGWEIVLLGSGLLLFFTGLYLSSHTNADFFSFPNVLKVIGISLKVVFVILFILKTRDK